MKTKVALVTGASSGIGEATALRLKALGYTVYAAARRLEPLVTVHQAAIHPHFHLRTFAGDAIRYPPLLAAAHFDATPFVLGWHPLRSLVDALVRRDLPLLYVDTSDFPVVTLLGAWS